MCIALALGGAGPFAKYLSESDEVAAITAMMWKSIDWCYICYAVSTQLATILLATQTRWFVHCFIFIFTLPLTLRLAISGISTSLWFPTYFTVSLGRSRFLGLELRRIRLGRITNGSCESATNPFAYICCIVDKHALLIVEVVLSSVLVLSRLWMAFGRFGCADGELQGRKELGFFVERTEE
jgi:hypothetical protein